MIYYTKVAKVTFNQHAFLKYKQQNEGSFVQVRICQYGAKQFMSRLSESAIDNVASLVRLNFKSQALPQFYS